MRMEGNEILTITGKIVRVLPVTRTPNNNIAQQIAIKQLYNKYPNIIGVTLWGDLVGRYKEGQDVIAYITIEGKLSSKGEHYNNKISAWRIIEI